MPSTPRADGGPTRADFGDVAHLFDAVPKFTSDKAANAGLRVGVNDCAYIGSGNGTLTEERMRGAIARSLHASDCL